MQNNQYGQKTTFKWPKRVPKVFFPRFRGVIWSIKVVSNFRFGDRKCHFWYPQNVKNGQNWPILGAKEWDFGAQNKNRDHFFKPTSPKNGGIDICVVRLPLLGGY